MPITSVLARTVVVPLDAPLALSGRSISSREFTLVRVTGNNLEGVGFCYAGSRGGRITTAAVRDLLREHAIGREPHEVEAIWDAMFRDSILQGRRGAVMRALSAIDIAIWDLRAKETGLPLCSLLGAYCKDNVPAYASGGYYQPGKTAQDLAREVYRYAEAGFPAVKIKIGRMSLDEEVQRVRACREAIGPNVPLFLDANSTWNSAAAAVQAIKKFEPYEPGWIEEPALPDEIEASADVAAAV